MLALWLPLLLFSTEVNGNLRECKQSRVGYEYQGKINTTLSGRTCQRWEVTSPHSHSWNTPISHPDFSMDDDGAGNHCRNPDNEITGPWCYTTDPGSRFEYCDVPFCSAYPECKNSETGTEYQGYISQTSTNTPCRRWDSIPTSTLQLLGTSPDLRQGDEDYCRNPDSKPEGPWCYISDSAWGYCDVPFCKPSANCKQTTLGEGYIGTVSMTKTGTPCQRWDKQAPHLHVMTEPGDFPDTTLSDAENHCRNPNSAAEGPWCYTIDADARSQYCDIPVCQDCKQSQAARDYAGMARQTISGHTCQEWSTQSPHPHTMTDPNRFPDPALPDAQNFCRNPDNKSGGPWCYTMDSGVEWEYCNIPMCEGCAADTPIKRRVNHVVQIGVDGLHPGCMLDASSGVPNMMLRLAREGVYTLENARTVIETWSAPGWSASLCGMPVETTGITGNSWSPPWQGGTPAITPINGGTWPLPCAFSQIKQQDANIRTAAFYDWGWIRNLANRGQPLVADYEWYCPDSYLECDIQLAANASDYIRQVMASSEQSYTFVYLGNVDAVGHGLGWCGGDYLAAVDLADSHVGMLIDAITDAGKLEDTLILLSSDHGGEGTAHGRYTDNDIKIPMFVRAPTTLRDTQFSHEVRNQDMVPTALFMMGLKQNPWWRGEVMYEAFEDEEVIRRYFNNMEMANRNR